MRSLKIAIPITLIAGIFLLAVQCDKKEVAEIHEKVVPVKLAAVQIEAVSIPIYGSGMLYSKKQMRLSFKTGGIVEKIAVKEGQNVRKGQMLAQLELDEIEAQVQQAQSGFEKAQRDYDRGKKLYADSVVTLEQMQNIETQLTVAKSNLQIAEFNLEYSTIKAPADGRILKRFIEQNELVGPGTPVFYFGSGREEWLVRIGVSDRDIVRAQLGDPATVKFDAYPDITFPAEVTGVAQAADPQNGTFEVEIQLDSQGKRLAAGFVGQVIITPQKSQKHQLVPIVSLVNARGNEASVFSVQENRAVKTSIITGAIIDDRIIILTGIDKIEKVVTAGAAYLRAGDKVEVQ